MMYEEYHSLRQDFLGIAESFVDCDVLDQLKHNYAHEIDSKRKLSEVKDLETLMRLLEKRDIISYDNIEQLWYISKMYIGKPELECKLLEYENWLQTAPPLPAYNMYQSDYTLASLQQEHIAENKTVSEQHNAYNSIYDPSRSSIPNLATSLNRNTKGSYYPKREERENDKRQLLQQAALASLQQEHIAENKTVSEQHNAYNSIYDPSRSSIPNLATSLNRNTKGSYYPKREERENDKRQLLQQAALASLQQEHIAENKTVSEQHNAYNSIYDPSRSSIPNLATSLNRNTKGSYYPKREERENEKRQLLQQAALASLQQEHIAENKTVSEQHNAYNSIYDPSRSSIPNLVTSLNRNTKGSYYPKREERENDKRQLLQQAVMLQISERLGRAWKDVARHLGIRECDIDATQIKYPRDFKKQSQEILKIYMSQFNREEWVINLIRALEKARRRDLREFVEELILKNRDI